jgi:hypothetical protein
MAKKTTNPIKKPTVKELQVKIRDLELDLGLADIIIHGERQLNDNLKAKLEVNKYDRVQLVAAAIAGFGAGLILATIVVRQALA